MRTGVATAACDRPPSSTASRSAAGSVSFTTTDAVGKGMRRVDLKLRTSAVRLNRWRISSPAAVRTWGGLPSRAVVEATTGAGTGAVLAASSRDAREGRGRGDGAAARPRLARGLGPPSSGVSERLADARGSSRAKALGCTSRSAAKTRIAGAAVPLLPLNVGEESSIHEPAFSPSGAYSIAACFMVRMSMVTQPRRRLSSWTASGGREGVRGQSRCFSRGQARDGSRRHLNAWQAHR